MNGVDIIHAGDALTVLKTLPSESVNCVVTSPPYYGLRDYGCEGQIGLEETPQEFIGKLIAVFSEIKRVLRKDGVVWVNLGDSYNGSGKGETISDKSAIHYKANQLSQKTDVAGMASKNLLMIPARFAIAMQDAGWILRSECVWVKPNPMPESVKDRPTKSHEMVYLFAKSQRYWYDADAIREPIQPSTVARYTRGWNGDGERGFPDGPQNHMHKFMANEDAKKQAIERGANHRSTFVVNTDPTPFAHFATFPQALIEPLILAGCPVGGVVLDPFMGSGTTAIVARRLGRHYVGIELNAEYAALAETRLLHNDKQELAAALQGKPTTQPMFTESEETR